MVEGYADRTNYETGETESIAGTFKVLFSDDDYITTPDFFLSCFTAEDAGIEADPEYETFVSATACDLGKAQVSVYTTLLPALTRYQKILENRAPIDGTRMVYSVCGVDVALTMPDEWMSLVTVLRNANGTSFYHKASSSAGWGGHLMTLICFPDDSYQFYPNFQVVASNENGTLIAVFPSDVQCSEVTASAYRSLYGAIEDILDTVEFPAQ